MLYALVSTLCMLVGENSTNNAKKHYPMLVWQLYRSEKEAETHITLKMVWSTEKMSVYQTNLLRMSRDFKEQKVS